MSFYEHEFLNFSRLQTESFADDKDYQQLIDFVTGQFQINKTTRMLSWIDFFVGPSNDSRLYRLSFKFIFSRAEPYLSMSGGFSYDLRSPIRKDDLIQDILISVPEFGSFRRSALSEFLDGATKDQ